MSVTFGAISKNRGWLFSDGRMHSPYKLENGVVVEKSIILNDNSNKTFSFGNTIIGSAIGLLKIDEENTTTFIKKYLKDNALKTLEEILPDLSSKLKFEMDKLNILPKSKEVEAILIRKYKGQVEMGVFEIRYNDGNLILNHAMIERGQNSYVYHCFGDGQAQNRIMDYFGNNITPLTPPTSIKKIAKEAMQLGIDNSMSNEFGNQNCGGEIFEQFL